MEVTKDFKVIIKEKYSENLYIQYDSLYQYHELGKTAEDSRIIFEKFANNPNGIVEPSNEKI